MFKSLAQGLAPIKHSWHPFMAPIKLFLMKPKVHCPFDHRAQLSDRIIKTNPWRASVGIGFNILSPGSILWKILIRSLFLCPAQPAINGPQSLLKKCACLSDFPKLLLNRQGWYIAGWTSFSPWAFTEDVRERALLTQWRRKDSWNHYVWDTNSITLSVPFSAKRFLKFISAAGLTPADVHLYRESCPQESTNLRCDRSLWYTCLLNEGDLGASQAEWRVQMRLWNPVLSYPSLIPTTQFQVI